MVIIYGHCHCVATSNPRNMRTALGPIARSTVPQGPEPCVEGPGDLIFDGVARRLYRYKARLSKLYHLTKASSKPKGRTGNGIPSSYGQNLIFNETDLIVISPVETCGSKSFSVELLLSLPVWAVGSTLRPLHRLARNVVEERLGLVVGWGTAVLAEKNQTSFPII